MSPSIKSSDILSPPHRKPYIPAPITIPSPTHCEVSDTSGVPDFLSDREKPTCGPLTPMLGSSGQGQGMLDPDLALIKVDEDTSIDDCNTTGCAAGGLHMADHTQMMAFAKRVSRLRFHSQCAPGTTFSDISTNVVIPSPGTSPSSSISSSLHHHFKTKSMKRSVSLPNIIKAGLGESKDIGKSSGNLTYDNSICDNY